MFNVGDRVVHSKYGPGRVCQFAAPRGFLVRTDADRDKYGGGIDKPGTFLAMRRCYKMDLALEVEGFESVFEIDAGR